MADFASHMFASSEASELSTPHLADSAFEPHPHSNHADWQDNMSMLSAYNHKIGSHPNLTGEKTVSDDSRARSRSQTNNFSASWDAYQLQPEPVSPQEPWASEHSSLELSPRSAQGEAGPKRGSNVGRQLHQLTPPDDGPSPDAATASTQYSAEYSTALEDSSIPAPLSAKSERARNAANQRHANAKKSRQDSRIDMLSPVSNDLPSSGEKREKYREKNRLAAAKCRAKKKTNVDILEQKARDATARNTQLKMQARELRDAFSELRSHALLHDASQGCHCQQVHQYNAHKAQEAARGAITLPALMDASLHGNGGLCPMMVAPFEQPGDISRRQSMSMPTSALKLHHRHHQHQNQHQNQHQSQHQYQQHQRSHSFAESMVFFQDAGVAPNLMEDDAAGFSDHSFDGELDTSMT